MLPSFLPPLTHGPMAPEIFSSRLHFTSSVALNAIFLATTYTWTNGSRDLQFSTTLHFKRGVECHLELI